MKSFQISWRGKHLNFLSSSRAKDFENETREVTSFSSAGRGRGWSSVGRGRGCSSVGRGEGMVLCVLFNSDLENAIRSKLPFLVKDILIHCTNKLLLVMNLHHITSSSRYAYVALFVSRCNSTDWLLLFSIWVFYKMCLCFFFLSVILKFRLDIHT